MMKAQTTETKIKTNKGVGASIGRGVLTTSSADPFYMNRKKKNAYQKAWAKTNKNKINSYKIKFLKQHPDGSDTIWKRYANKYRFGGNKYLVFERDHYTCQDCGKTHDETRLDVHHKDRTGRNFIEQGKPSNNGIHNLITLCHKCHGRLHRLEYLANLKTCKKGRSK